jgi:TonB-dependent receptor
MTSKKIYLIVVFLTASIFSFGQGAIKGKITEASTNQPLPGASVFIKNSTKGTSTDLQGDFLINNIKAGSVELIVNYLGYESKTITVEVTDKTVKNVDINLSSIINQLSDVVISGNLQGQAKALNQQKSADNIKNVVAADQIGRFPDPNAAEALQRIPGVNIERDQGEGRYVLIRGLSPNFTNMNVNGEQIPSPEADVRFVALDAIPSDQLASMEISKTLTPDLDGDAIGGSVNLITRTAQSSKPSLNGTLVSGYNNLMGKFNGQGSINYGQRFLNNKLGIMINASYYSNNLGSDNWERDLDGSTDPANHRFELRDYELTRTRTGLSSTIDYKFNNRNEIYARTLYTRFTDREWRRTYYFNPGEEEIERSVKDRFEEQIIGSYNLGAKHTFNKFLLDYEVSFSDAYQNTPYDNEVTFIAGTSSSVGFNSSFPTLSSAEYMNNSLYEFDQLEMGDTYAKDQNLTGKFNVTVPYRTGKSDGAIKFGGKARSKTKSFTINANKFENLGGVPNLNEFEGGLRDEKFLNDKYKLAVNSDIGRVIKHFNQNPGMYELQVEDKTIDEALESYDATEDVAAAYLMARHQLKRLLLIGGVRYESTRVTYNSKEAVIDINGDLQEILPVKGGTTYDYLLPQFSLRYELTANTNIRAAATYSYARPNFSQIIPAQEANLQDRKVSVGNANLLPVTAANFDLLAEHYFGKVGIVSGGVFFKQLDDFIYSRTLFSQVYNNNPNILVDISQAQNGNQAKLIGAELAFHRNLSFLSDYLKTVSVYFNYTYTHSVATIQSRTADLSNPNAEEEIRLPGQAKNVGNVSLAFDYKRFSARGSANFNGEYLSEISETKDFDVYVKSRMQVDLNLSYALNKRARCFAEILNITNQPFEMFQGNKEVVIQREFYSFWTRLGVKIDLN